MAMPTFPVDAYEALVPLRWGDLDAYNHVNNARLVQLLEQARVISLRDWFGQDRRVLDEGVLVARHEIEYLAPLDYRPEPVSVRMWVTAIGAVGFSVGYVVTDPAAGNEAGPPRPVYAVAATELVFYDFATASPRRTSAEDRAGLSAHLGGPVPFRKRRS